MACVKPLSFENDDDVFRYTLAGTCFIVRQDDSLYAVTARHCVQKFDNNFVPEEIRVPYFFRSDDWLRFSKMAYTDPNLGDEQLVDLAVLKVAQEALDQKQAKGIQAFPILRSRSTCVLSTVRKRLVFAGHPFTNNEIDYDRRAISYQCCWGKAEYVGPSEVHGCHKMRLTDVGNIKDTNGLSGSPVFQLVEGSNRGGFVYLAGVIHRATMSSGLVHFVDASHIFPMLNVLNHQSESLADHHAPNHAY